MGLLNGITRKIFGSKSDRDIREINPIVEQMGTSMAAIASAAFLTQIQGI